LRGADGPRNASAPRRAPISGELSAIKPHLYLAFVGTRNPERLVLLTWLEGRPWRRMSTN